MKQTVTQLMVNELDEYVIKYYYLIFTLRYLQENPDKKSKEIDLFDDFSNAVKYVGIEENITPKITIEEAIQNFNKRWSNVLDFPNNNTTHFFIFEEEPNQYSVLRLNNLKGVIGNFGSIMKIKLLYGCALDIFSYAVSFSKNKEFSKELEGLILEYDQKLCI